MRQLLLTSLAMSALCCTAATAQDDPYEAYVIADEATVYAGPSKRFYATAKLPYATAVEVFLREPGGWLAIRPPEGSFSWVPAAQVEETDDKRVVKIAGEEAASWIGTNLERVREHKFHVHLQPGEVIQVLGKRTVETEAGEGQVWLKISPPAGEFRWIHRDDISRDKPEEPVEQIEQVAAEEEVGTAAEPVVVEESESAAETVREAAIAATPPREPKQLTKPRAAIKLTDIHAQPRSPVKAAAYSPPAVGPAIKSPEDDSPAGDGFRARNRQRLEITSLPQSSALTPAKSAPRSFAGNSVAKKSAPAIGLKTLDPGEFAQELATLDVDLALMLSQNKQTWNLAPLKQRAERLIESGPSAADRGLARLLMDKIREVEKTFNVPDLGPAANPLSTDPDKIATPAGSLAIDPKYDGTGILKPVLTSGRPVAPYALIDGDGNTLCYVTPSPALNLNRYVNKEVGIYGRRGFIETLGSPHVTAQRVIDLGRQRR